MQQTAYCTIITPDYLHYALALRQSIAQFDEQGAFYIFISEATDSKYRDHIDSLGLNVTVLFCDQLCVDGYGKLIYEKYFTRDKDKFRWSMKPVLINELLEKELADLVFYIDCDIRFYNDFSFLIKQLAGKAILLSPHFRSIDPLNDEDNFIQLYIYGLFNGGFVGVTKKGVPAMRWWAGANHFICEVNAAKGQYVDQTHLNLLPVYFDDVEIIRHRGCNLAGWNLEECRRTWVDNKLLIDGRYDPVFVHYSISTIHFIKTGKDPLLAPLLAEYESKLTYYEPVMKDAMAVSSYAFSVQQVEKQPAGLLGKIKNKIKGNY